MRKRLTWWRTAHEYSSWRISCSWLRDDTMLQGHLFFSDSKWTHRQNNSRKTFTKVCSMACSDSISYSEPTTLDNRRVCALSCSNSGSYIVVWDIHGKSPVVDVKTCLFILRRQDMFLHTFEQEKIAASVCPHKIRPLVDVCSSVYSRFHRRADYSH